MPTLNIGGRQVEAEFVEKPAVEFDGLRELAEQFCNSCVEQPCRDQLAAKIRKHADENMPFAGEFVDFNWGKNFDPRGMTLEQLQACRWCNNLDSLIDYKEQISMPPEIAFAALECARQGRSTFVEEKNGWDLIWFGQAIIKS